MRKNLQERRNKPYFCHDENLEFLYLKKACNKNARFIHVVNVMGNQGTRDEYIIKECDKKNFHLITHNTSHFQKPHDKIKIGIICVNLKDEDVWISKFNKLLSKFNKHDDYFYKSIFIGDTIIIKNRKTGDQSTI